MFFNPRALCLGAFALLISTVSAADCKAGPWGEVQQVGGQGGTEFCHTKYDLGVVMTGVEVWAAKKEIEAIQFYFSDGSNSGQIGKVDKNKKHARLDWDSSKTTISQVKTWTGRKGASLGRVYIRTSDGQELDVGIDTDGQETFETKTAAGIMLGAVGRGSDVVDNLGFLFLKSKIDKMAVEDVVFKDTPEELNKRQQGLQTFIIDYADHTNSNTEANETFTFTKSDSKTASKKYTQGATHTFGFSNALELSGKLFGIGAKDTTTLSYQYSNTHSEESSKENQVSLSYSVATMLKPGQRVFCKSTAMFGSYKGEYTSNVHIWLEDGTEFKFAQDGEMEQVNYSQAHSVCQDKEFPADNAVPDPDKPKRAVKFIA